MSAHDPERLRHDAQVLRLREALERALPAEDEAAALSARVNLLEAELGPLRARDAELRAFEAGGWWRLRARVLRLQSRLRGRR